MAGEHILELLMVKNARIDYGYRWLIVKRAEFCKTVPYSAVNVFKAKYKVYERKPYQRNNRTVIETKNEKLACKVLLEYSGCHRHRHKGID